MQKLLVQGLVVVAVFITMILSGACASAAQNDAIAQHYVAGMQYWAAGNVDGAISEWRTLLAIDPSNSLTKDKLIMALGRKVELLEAKLEISNLPVGSGQPLTAAISPRMTVQRPVISDYLEFVKGIEDKRQSLPKDTGGITALVDNPQVDISGDPLGSLKKEFGNHLTAWQSLLRQFDARPSSPECAEFAGAYRGVISAEAKGIRRLSLAVNGINANSVESLQQALNDLEQLMTDGSLQGDVDKAIALANTKLTDICTRSGIVKPFQVKKEN